MLNIKALESNKNISARNYWKQRLKNFRAENCFDGATDDQQLPSGNTYGVYTVEIPRHVSGNLNGIASSDKAKHIVLLSALSVLIQKYSSTGKVLLFTHTYSEEEKQDAGKGIIPVGIDIAPDTDFSTLVNTVKENLFSDFRHARYPLERILAGSPAIKRISGVGLGMKGIALPIDVNGCSLDLYFSFHAEDQKLDVWYHHSRFTYNFVQNITAVFLSLLSRITQNSRNSLQNIPLLTEQERLQVFNELTVFGNHASQAESVLVRTSYHQERLWFIDKFEKDYLYNGSPVYHNIPLEIGLKGTLNVEWLEESINSVIRHYSALRTCFVEVKDIIFQQPVNDAGIQLEKRTHRHKGSSLEAEITSERDKPFDPATPPVRAVLFETDTDSYKLLLIFHHLVVDRHATLQVARDILENYRRRSQGELFLEETERLRYAQFSEWQRGPLSKLYFYLFPYWKQRLGTRLKALELPTDRPRSAVHIYKGAAIDVSLSQHISSQVLRYAEQRLISPRLIFMAAFKILLYKYVQHEEIVIGTSTDSRNNGVLKDVVGPLANLLPVRSQIFPSDSFQEYLTRLNNQFNADLSHSDIPFDKLVSYLAPEKDMSRTALFDVLFQYENKSYEIPRIDDLHIDLFENNYGYGKYDLSLLLLQSEDGVEGKMLYNSEYFDQASVELMMQRFSRLLGSLLLQPSRQLWEIDILDDVEKKGLLDSLDYTNSHYPEDKTILDLFDEQVTKWPGNTAVQYEGVAITYAQLDEQAGQVAAQLTARGVKADAVVGLLMDRSIEMVVGMLGILKAGGAYLPVDITYPEERRNYLLDNSQTRLVLTTNEFADLVKPGISVVLIEDREQFNGVLPDKPLPSNLCYVIYTSGTTGNPKGVMVEHRNVVRLFCNDDFQFSFGPADIWTMFHSHCFDFSVWEIFGALLTGGKVIIVPKMTARDTGLYLKLLREEGVTVLNQTPSAFYNLLQLSVTGLSLRYVIFGGEALSPGKLHSWREMYPGVKLINMYGITETTVHVTYKEITEKEIGSNISNIGKPIPTLSVYLLDEHQRLVPAGITGELYVGGSGVSRGYLGNEALTSAKFVQDPYKTGGRLYRTGDLGRLLPGGEIEYLGRKDHQVQLRGFRIELGEIAYALSGNSRIGEVVVEAREKEDDKYLVAYYTADQEIKVSELRTYLLGKIPDYMVPSYFVYLDHFPLTSNGKLDRAALPEPHISATDEYIPPSGIVETKLVEIWADILKLDKDSISVNSSFFDLGGHSLRATVLVNKILSELGTEVPLKEIFERRVVSSLAEYIRQVGAMQVSRVPKATPKPYYSLSPAQKAIYYFSEYDKQTLAYNMPRVVVMEGSLDKDKLKQVMEQLVARHEAFRTSFQVIGEEVVQQIADSAVLTITHHVAAEEDVKQLVQQIIARFDLSSAPLLRVALIEVQPEKHVLVVDTHHLVMDGTSWGIFIREFKTLFNNGTLAPLTLQYKDYVEWLDTEERRAEMDKQNDFWYGELSRNMPQLDLPVDFERPEQKNNHAGNVNFRIEEEQTGHLKAIADKEGATLFIVLLSVYNILLEKITNQEDIMIGIPASGRDHSDLQHMLGMFVKILPFRNFPAEQLSFRQFMNEVKERTFAFLENQSYEYHRLLDRLKIRRARAHSALYDVMFVFQNFEETRFVIPDLKISSYKASHLVAEFDMSLTAFENNGEIRLAIGYQDSLFKPETILKFAAYFRKIVAAVVADPDIKISDIYVVSEDERKALLDRFRGNGNNIQTETILSRFEKSVSRFQGKTAIRYKDISWSYTDVDRISNQIAYHLKENAGVGKSMLVGVMMERDEYLVPTILGILKTGAAFVPLDPAYPPGISDTLISKAGVGVLITGNITFDVSAINVKVLNIQQEWNPILESRELPLASGVTADDLAYVMYSLESLSNPTGFMFSHQALFSALAGMQDTYPVQETGGYLLRTNTSVQSALQEIFNWCLSGGCLSILPPENESEIDKIISWIEAYGITHVHFEAPVFSAFTDVLTRRGREKIKSLQHIFLTGMGTWADPVRKFSQLNTGILLEDMFGVPEYAIFACGRTLPAPGATNARILYQALPGAALYTVDRNNKLQADGLYGSLCIGGTGLASDYLTEEELCHQLYFPLPELEVNVIKTPWQARYLAENGIEFSAREAGPLMLNGHRAVLSEIEAVIMRHGEVTNTVVIIPGNQPPGKRLLALVELPDKSATVGKIKKYLRSQLPRHMMPTDVIKFGHLPLTAAGTVDRDAIPALLERSAIVIDEAAQPQTAVEKQIALIWKELMGLEQVTLNDTFFGLGGHSLLLVTNNERMKKQFNVDLPFSIYFNCTLKQIAEKVSQTSPHKVAE